MNIIRWFTIAVLALTLVSFAGAEEKKDTQSTGKGLPLTAEHKKWLNDEVNLIISDYEKNAFLSLKSNEARDNFIAAFWLNRDPTPGTEKNEFKDEHYTRLAYANKMYGRTSARAGSKTDRGKIYVLMGKPSFIRRDPNPFEYHPMELWQYSGYRGYGLPGSLYFLFFQEYEGADYTLYSPIHDGIRSLYLQTRTYKAQSDEELYDHLAHENPEVAHAAYSSIPTEGGSVNDPNVGLITTEMVQTKLDNARNYDLAKRTYVEDFILERPSVQVYTSIETGGIRDGVYWFQAPNGFFYVDYAVEYEPDKLDMGEYENYYTSLTIDGVIATPEKVQIDQVLSSHEINLTPDQFNQVKNLPFQYQGRKPLFPGKYEFTLIMNNNVSRRSITFTHDLDIPNPATATSPVISPIMPLRSVEKAPADDGRLRPFQMGEQLYTPNIPAKYAKTGTMPVYHQIFFPLKFAEAKTLFLRYVLLGGEKTEVEVTEPLNLSAGALAGNSIDVRKDIPLENATLGVKKFFVELRSGDNVLTASAPIPVTIEATAQPSVWKFDVAIPNYDSAYHSYTIAMQLMKLNRDDQALAVLKQAYAAHPDSPEIRVQLMRAALKVKNYQAVVDLGGPAEIKNPRDKEILWLLGWGYYGLGKYEDAMRFFERYRIEDPKKVEVLNLLADIYFRLNQTEKSLERVQQSLALKPDQQDLLELKKKLESPKQ